MGHCIRWSFRQQIDWFRRQFAQHAGLPFSGVLPAQVVATALQSLGVRLRDAFTSAEGGDLLNIFVQEGNALFDLPAIVIAIIVIANAALGFFQESSAANAVAALAVMTAANSTVLRDGVTMEIDAEQLVPGDVVVADGAFEWDDLGSWTALARHLKSDPEGNCAVADFIHVDGARNLIFDARTRNRTPIAVVGLRDAILVQTDDAVLYCLRAEDGLPVDLLLADAPVDQAPVVESPPSPEWEPIPRPAPAHFVVEAAARPEAESGHEGEQRRDGEACKEQRAGPRDGCVQLGVHLGDRLLDEHVPAHRRDGGVDCHRARPPAAAGGGVTAAGLAYSVLVAILPTLLILVSILGFMVSDPAERDRILARSTTPTIVPARS